MNQTRRVGRRAWAGDMAARGIRRTCRWVQARDAPAGQTTRTHGGVDAAELRLEARSPCAQLSGRNGESVAGLERRVRSATRSPRVWGGMVEERSLHIAT